MSRFTFGRELRGVIASALKKIEWYYNNMYSFMESTLEDYDESIDHSDDAITYIISDGIPNQDDMFVSDFSAVYYGDTEVESLTKNGLLRYKKTSPVPPEPPGPSIDWDETKIGVMRLTEDKEPTDEIEYFMTWNDVSDYIGNLEDTDPKLWIHQGILMDPVPLLGDSQFAGIQFTYIDIYHQPEIPDYCFDGYYGYYFDRITGLEGVTRFGDRAFGDQHYLEQFEIPSTVRELGYSALSGLSFTSIVIPEGVTEIADELFYLDPYLTSVTLPSTLTTIGSNAFWRCYALPSITIPSSVTSIDEYVFGECTSLTSIIVNKPSGSISGAPWGAENATVTWEG